MLDLMLLGAELWARNSLGILRNPCGGHGDGSGDGSGQYDSAGDQFGSGAGHGDATGYGFGHCCGDGQGAAENWTGGGSGLRHGRARGRRKVLMCWN